MGAEKRWLFALFSAALVSLHLLLLFSIIAFSSPEPFPYVIHHGTHYPPSFAYYISGGGGDKGRIFRLLLAVYHPRNRYLLHLGADASDEERMELVFAVNSVPAVRTFANVDVLGKPTRLTYMGSTHLAATLRAVAILLKVDSGWNWFVELSASDYPLVTQDDLSHVFSSVSRDLNFIDLTSDLRWKESQRFQPIIIDPSIYLARKSHIFHATEKRPTPDGFKLFTGKVYSSIECHLFNSKHAIGIRYFGENATCGNNNFLFFAGSRWNILSRSFLNFCIMGWDNLPRTLLMYFNNVVLAEEGYFHSVICNAPDFMNSTVNSDLRYMIWDNPPRMEPHNLNTSDFHLIIQSGAAFARQFQKDDPVLDMIDEKILNRGRKRAVPGAWCSGRRSWWTDPCSQWCDVNVMKPGPRAKQFEETITNLLDDRSSETNQCK